MSLYEKHKVILERAIEANKARTFFAQYPENPKAYSEDAATAGLSAFHKQMNSDFTELLQDQPLRFEGEEVSPYLQLGLGIKYPVFADKILVLKATNAKKSWANTSPNERAGILIETLEQVKERFFEIAHATMHTTGQSFMMSFQASGPHANDRALEAIAMGYEEITRFPSEVVWDKPMGKFNIVVNKKWKPVPKGVGLVIGCSTFPTWNTLPGVYANLITGNPVIVKPHSKAILPIAIVVAEIQKVLNEQGYDPNIIQLAVDSSKFPITKELVAHPDVKLIDYTGNSIFGNWLETQTIFGKTVFTEKAGVNSVILDSTSDFKAMMANLSFSVSLYSGQMCTAPQNFFIPEIGIETENGHLSFDEVCQAFVDAVKGIAENPKMGPGVLAAIQNDATLARVSESKTLVGAIVILESAAVANPEFPEARTASPTVLVVDASNKDTFAKELFGPIVLLVKTKNTEESVKLAKEMALTHGAISCAAYSTNNKVISFIGDEMAEAFTPVSFNLTGGIFVNQNAAFSDFHVTGGNPAGNASFTDSGFVSKRFVWVGHRYIQG